MSLAIAVVGCLLLAACGASGDDALVLPQDDLELLSGGTYDLDQGGQARALNLWATWCAPCRAELPAFDAVARSVSGVEIVGINTGDPGPKAAELVDELNLSFTQVLDPKASVQRALKITGMPATIFVDSSGQVVDVHNGELEQHELESLLTEHFGASFEG